MLCSLIGTPGNGLANPLPSGLIFVHVQPPVENFCEIDPITTCEEIVQYTDATGVLEFDLYIMVPFAIPMTYYGLETALEWPAGWVLLGWEPCHGGEGWFDPIGSGGNLNIIWANCPQTENEVFLAARFIMDVTGYGKFGTSGYGDATVTFDCPPDDYSEIIFMTSAEAGVVCSYCYAPCDFSSACRPVPDPAELHLTIVQGESSESQIHVPVQGGGLMSPCMPSFVTTADYMTVTYEELGWNDYMVTLTVNTEGLATGFHQAWFRAEDTCVGCTEVIVEVLPPVNAVPGDQPGQPELSTWGAMKALYH
jgi:hypothetical protein